MFKTRNLPRVGHPRNDGYFTTTQLNIAGGVESDSVVSLEADIGEAGGSHNDGSDHANSYTAMFPLSRLQGFHPGFFFIQDLGIYFRLDNYSVICFKGLMYHGGSIPRPLSSEEIVDPSKALRLTMIFYPDKAVKEDAITIPLVPTGSNTFIDYDPKLVQLPKSSFYLNFGRDSSAVMSPNDFREFFVKCLYKTLSNSLTILPEDRSLQLDPEAFFRAFSFTNQDEERVSLAESMDFWPFLTTPSPDHCSDLDFINKELNERYRQSFWCLSTQLNSKILKTVPPPQLNHSLDPTSSESRASEPSDNKRKRDVQKQLASSDNGMNFFLMHIMVLRFRYQGIQTRILRWTRMLCLTFSTIKKNTASRKKNKIVKMN